MLSTSQSQSKLLPFPTGSQKFSPIRSPDTSHSPSDRSRTSTVVASVQLPSEDTLADCLNFQTLMFAEHPEVREIHGFPGCTFRGVIIPVSVAIRGRLDFAVYFDKDSMEFEENSHVRALAGFFETAANLVRLRANRSEIASAGFDNCRRFLIN
jgi:hypothetical protein